MRSTATYLGPTCEWSEPIVGGQIAMTQARSGTLADRYDRGVSLRRKTQREKHADLLGPSDRDPVAILAAGDRTRIPKLIPVRYERMLTSPFAFLRGACAASQSYGVHGGAYRMDAGLAMTTEHRRCAC